MSENQSAEHGHKQLERWQHLEAVITQKSKQVTVTQLSSNDFRYFCTYRGYQKVVITPYIPPEVAWRCLGPQSRYPVPSIAGTRGPAPPQGPDSARYTPQPGVDITPSADTKHSTSHLPLI